MIKGLSLIVLFCIFAFGRGVASQPAKDEGLVAWYRFDEGAGFILHDGSGNRNEGKILGAEWVKGKYRFALDFDGFDDYVDCGDNETLRIAGALTLAIWLKTASTAQQYLISYYGWNIYIAPGGIPHFETRTAANDAWDTLSARRPLLADEWSFVAAVYNPEAQRLEIYVNGLLNNTKPRRDGSIGGLHRSKLILGRWSGSSSFYFNGLMSEVRIYNRALSQEEIKNLFQIGRQSLDRTISPSPYRISLKPHLFFNERKVFTELRLSRSQKPPGELGAEVELIREGKALPIQRHKVSSLPGTGSLEAIFSLRNLLPGDYRIRAMITDQEGRLLTQTSTSLTLPKNPWWLGSEEGRTDKVLPPWTPLRVRNAEFGMGKKAIRGRDSAFVVECWSRSYEFSRLPFPSDIEIAGASVLAEPIQLIARVEGQIVRWRNASIKWQKRSPAKVIFLQNASNEALKLSSRTEVEYDGMMRIDWQVEPRRYLRLEELTFRIPLRQEHAKYLYYYPDWAASWSAHKPGTLPKEGAVMSFNPTIWVGDEERGLEWFCESDQNWFNSDPRRAIEIIPEGNTVILRLNLVSRAIELSPQALTHPTARIPHSLTYTFGLQATPVKPKDKDAWDYRITWLYTPVYGIERKGADGKSQLDRLADLGVKTLALMDWTDILCYNTPTEPEKLRSFVKECHRHGIQVLVYFGFQMSEQAPEYKTFLDDCALWMSSAPYSYAENPDNYPPKPTQQVYRVCYRSQWQDFVVAGIARLMDEYDIDGVYLDGTGMPLPCYNLHHGCGYRKPEGDTGATYPVFSGRETLRRIYAVVKLRKPQGQVNLHQSGFMLIPVLAWATSYWDGEQLWAPPGTFPLDRLPLDMFRTEFMGHQWGVPAEFLHYVLPCKYEDEWAFTLLHDVPVRGYELGQIELEAKLWQLMDQFGRKEAQWLPYWRNAEYATVKPEDALVSLYWHPKNGLLAVVSNLGRQEAMVTVQLNLERFDLKGSFFACDALTGEPVRLEGGQFNIPLKSLEWKLIWVKGIQK